MYKNLGLQLFSVRNHMEDERGVRDTFMQLAEMGYTEVQTIDKFPGGVESFAKAASDAGIKIIGTHYTDFRRVTDFSEYVRVHKILGTTNAGVGGGCSASSVEEIYDYIEKANAHAKRLSEYGMKFTYHHHSYEFARIGEKRKIDYLIEGFDKENISFVLDTYWLQYAGVDINEWIEKLAGRVDILHIKDMAVIPDENDPYITEIGNGNINFKRVLHTAEMSGVKHICVEQDSWPADSDSLISAKKSIDYFKKYLSE